MTPRPVELEYPNKGFGFGVWGLGFRVLRGFREYIGIMEKKMETTIRVI